MNVYHYEICSNKHNERCHFDLYIHDNVVQYNGLMYICALTSFKSRALGMVAGSPAAAFLVKVLPLGALDYSHVVPFSTGPQHNLC
jgi:hypothetical protein